MPLETDDETPAEEEAASLDRISTLPDEVIHHVLGLLPAPEAVRTSVLARGWRHHWKYMRRLVVTVFHGDPVLSFDWLNRFMAHLLRDLRANLDLCDIYLDEGQCDEVTALYAYRWVRQAVSKFNVRELMISLELQCEEPSFELSGQPLVSRRLARLELCYVELKGRILDFSKCTALEDLRIYRCDISTKNISSQTLKHLRIEHCDFCRKGSPTSISVPNLVSLKLEYLLGADPVLQIMPLLETAIVELQCNHDYNYVCQIKTHWNGECCGLCEGCIGSDAHSGGCCMLLHGLSSATHLELKVPFAKVLENVTIEFKGYMHKTTMELDGNHKPTVELSEHLKLVKIKHGQNDERVSKH